MSHPQTQTFYVAFLELILVEIGQCLALDPRECLIPKHMYSGATLIPSTLSSHYYSVTFSFQPTPNTQNLPSAENQPTVVGLYQLPLPECYHYYGIYEPFCGCMIYNLPSHLPVVFIFQGPDLSLPFR